LTSDEARTTRDGVLSRNLSNVESYNTTAIIHASMVIIQARPMHLLGLLFQAQIYRMDRTDGLELIVLRIFRLT